MRDARARTEFSSRTSMESPLLDHDSRHTRESWSVGPPQAGSAGDAESQETEVDSRGGLCRRRCRRFVGYWGSQGKHDGNEANSMIGRLGAWLAMNAALFGCQRVAVNQHLPYDGIRGWKNARFALESLNHLCLYATGAAVFAHILAPRRAGHLLGRFKVRVYFFAIALGIGLLFSAISDLDSLRTSLSNGNSLDWQFMLVLAVLGAVVLLAFGFQIYLAHKNGGIAAYLAPRFVLILAYVAYSWALVANGDSWEIHHFFLAWLGSLFCCFDHPVSVFCLAATTGIFVQGVAAYGTAELFTKKAS